MDGDVFKFGWIIHAIIFFIGIWIYAMSSWGFLLGFCLGWIPSAVGAAILALAWPLYWLLGGLLVFFIIKDGS